MSLPERTKFNLETSTRPRYLINSDYHWYFNPRCIDATFFWVSATCGHNACEAHKGRRIFTI